MNTYFKKSLMLICGILSLASCQNDTEHLLPEGQNVCKVNFKANVQSFDTQTTRAADVEWKDKDCVYLQFPANGQYVKGQLVYDKTANDWTLTYNGSLSATSSGTCTAYYFLGDYTKDEKKVALTPNTSVYKDEEATYSYSNGVLSISTNLSPITGRIRFKGTAGSMFKVHGLQYYSAYNIMNSTLEEELLNGKREKEYVPLTIVIGEDGYSQYVYSTLPESNRELGIEYEQNVFTTLCENNVLAIGKSGSMTVPTEEKYNGWKRTRNKYISVDDAIFEMVFVEGGTFLMNEGLLSVTLSDYYIGETEVTKALWNKVMGTTHTSELRYPITDIWDNCQEFAKKLSSMTGKKFRMPTEAEWEFAARGGNESQGYKYSGSNNAYDVACSSYSNGYYTYYIGPIASRRENELGIYDMTGNASEWCSDWFGDYPVGSATNPTGPNTGTTKVFRGGVNSSSVYLNIQRGAANTSATYGLRVVMEL